MAINCANVRQPFIITPEWLALNLSPNVAAAQWCTCAHEPLGNSVTIFCMYVVCYLNFTHYGNNVYIPSNYLSFGQWVTDLIGKLDKVKFSQSVFVRLTKVQLKFEFISKHSKFSVDSVSFKVAINLRSVELCNCGELEIHNHFDRITNGPGQRWGESVLNYGPTSLSSELTVGGALNWKKFQLNLSWIHK